MKRLNIAHFIATAALAIVLIVFVDEYCKQKQVLSVMANALVTLQEAELNRQGPCGQTSADARTLARR